MSKITAPALLATGVILLAGCGSSSNSGSASSSASAPSSGSAVTSGSASGSGSAVSSSSAATTGSGASSAAAPAGPVPKSAAAGTAVNPNAPESLPPGDIPDTIAYVPYVVPSAGYTVSTPEGWSRSTTAGSVVFTDKLNAVRIAAVAARAPITVAAVKRAVVPTLATAVKGFRLQSVTAVNRRAGPAIRTAYLGYSQPDSVTGKFGVLAFERYDFAHNGRDVILTLSAPDGSDNVDPWNKVTNSLKFTR